MLAGIVAFVLASCGQGGEYGANTNDPFVDYEESAAPWSTKIPVTKTPSVSRPIAPAIAQPGVHCGWVSTRVTGDKPCVVLSGQVDCIEAMTVIQKYFNSIAQDQEQALFSTFDGWSCLRPTAPRPSHAGSYYTCTAIGGVGTVRIG